MLSTETCDAGAVERITRAARRQWAHRTRRGTRTAQGVQIVWQHTRITVMEGEMLVELQSRDLPHGEVRILVAVSRAPQRLQHPVKHIHAIFWLDTRTPLTRKHTVTHSRTDVLVC